MKMKKNCFLILLALIYVFMFVLNLDEDIVFAEDDEYDSVFASYDNLSFEDVKSFYYNQLTSFEKGLYERMLDMTCDDNSFIISKEELDSEDIDIKISAQRALNALIHDKPMYHNRFEQYVTIESSEEQFICTIPLTLISDYVCEKAEAKLDQIKRTFSNTKDDRYTLVAKLYNYLGETASYDLYYPFGSEKKWMLNDSAAGILVYNTAVCEGYAMAVKAICNDIGIPCLIVGTSGHEWNFIEMEDGKWYSLDFTDARQYKGEKFETYTQHWLLGRYSSNYVSNFNYMGTPLYMFNGSVFKYPKLSDQQYSKMKKVDLTYKLAKNLFVEPENPFDYIVNEDGKSCTITEYRGEQSGDLIIPSSIDGYDVTAIGDGAFLRCRGFDGKLIFPDSIESIGNSAFLHCDHICGTIVLPKKLICIDNYAFLGDCGITELVFPDLIEEINYYAFYNCTGLKGDLILPNSLKWVESAFVDTGYDGSFYLPDSLKWNEDMIAGSNFNSIVVSKKNENYCVYDGVLYNKEKTILLACPKGRKGKIKFAKTLKEIGGYAFYKCNGLKGDLILNEGLEKIGEAAFFSSGVDGKISFPKSLKEIGDFAFTSTGITGDLIIPDAVTYIGNRAFGFCEGLEGHALVLSNSLEYIGDQAFFLDGFYGDLIIPSSVKTVGYRAFEDCVYLTRVYIPKGIEQIGQNAFWMRTKNVLFFYAGTKNDWKKVKKERSVMNTDAKLFYNGVDVVGMAIVGSPQKKFTVQEYREAETRGYGDVLNAYSVKLTMSNKESVIVPVTLKNKITRSGALAQYPAFPSDDSKVVITYGKLKTSFSIEITTNYSNEWVDGHWFDSSGKSSYPYTLSWKKNSKGWWVVDTAGWYPRNQWQKIDGKWYYFKSNGYMASNEWCNGYWLNKNGSWTYKKKAFWRKDSISWWYGCAGWYAKSQWQKIDGKWYYFDEKGYITIGTKLIGDNYYSFDENGVCLNP